MRQNEICPLLISDVKTIGSHLCFEVEWTFDEEEQGTSGTTKSIKTLAALRIIPVHPELIRLGFLRYLEEVRAICGNKRLFPDLSLSKSGSYAANYSKWFANFLDHVGVTDSKKNFHSFRHTFRDAARRADMSPDRARWLGGWKGTGSDARYGRDKEVEAQVLGEEIGKIAYPGLDLDHLLPELSL